MNCKKNSVWPKEFLIEHILLYFNKKNPNFQFKSEELWTHWIHVLLSKWWRFQLRERNYVITVELMELKYKEEI